MSFNSLNAYNPVNQIVYTSTSSVISCSTTLPRDNTIPQQTEGDEVITLAISPISTTSKLLIEFFGYAGLENAVTPQIALFQDSTSNALAANSYRPGMSVLYLGHAMTSGTTSSTTFKIRIGPTGGGYNMNVNGDNNANRLLGGVSLATLKITEFKG